MAVLCERLEEVLPRDKVEVTVEHGRAIRLRGVGARHGATMWLSPMALWRSSQLLGMDERLQLFLDEACQQIQNFLSHGPAGRWPTVEARPKVAIGREQINVWWGGSRQADAEVMLRSISRQDINL